MEKIIAVRFFKSDIGNEPVKDWLLSDRKIIGADIQTVEFGFPIGMPLVKKVDTGECDE